MPSPAELKAQLDQYVIGQEDAKRTLASALSSHYRAVEYGGEVDIGKSNLLIIGPTGTGKTHVVQTAARLLRVPFAQTNATAITPSGWAGDDPESVIRTLWKTAKAKKMSFQDAQRGIVYIDEIDKIAVKGEAGPAAAGGFSTVQIQQALLKVIEGTEIIVDGNPFSTENVLFIASGAFVGLEDAVRKRESGGRFVRAAPDPNVMRRLQTIDLVQFGLIPEFVGRFPVTAHLRALAETDVVAILRDVKNSLLEQERAKLSVTGCTLEMDEVVLRGLARNALAQGTGARGLRTLMAKLMEPILFNLGPNSAVSVTADGVVVRPVPVASMGGDHSSPLSFDSESAARSAPLLNSTERPN